MEQEVKMNTKSQPRNVNEVLRTFTTDAEKGLSSGEAAARQLREGYNEFEKTKHTTLWQKFISQFKSFMIIVLLVASVISGITGYMNGEGITDAFKSMGCDEIVSGGQTMNPSSADFIEAFKKLDSWSQYLITSYEDTEKYIGRKADKNRKIYNGMMKTYYYQYIGPRPPKRDKEEVK